MAQHGIGGDTLLDPDALDAARVVDTDDKQNSRYQMHDHYYKGAEVALGIAPYLGSGAPTTSPIARTSSR